MKLFFNRDSAVLSPEGIKKIEQVRIPGSRYLFDTELKGSNGQWTNLPLATFYEPNPKFELGHTHYFGIYRHPVMKSFMIVEASASLDADIIAIASQNNELIHSRYGHDYRSSKDETVFIDGGRSSTRYGFSLDYTKPEAILLNITVKKGELSFTSRESIVDPCVELMDPERNTK